MAKKQISKISDKLKKAGDSLTVNFYDNGFMVEVSGRNHDDDWASAKIMCGSMSEVTAIIAEVADMERD